MAEIQDFKHNPWETKFFLNSDNALESLIIEGDSGEYGCLYLEKEQIDELKRDTSGKITWFNTRFRNDGVIAQYRNIIIREL